MRENPDLMKAMVTFLYKRSFFESEDFQFPPILSCNHPSTPDLHSIDDRHCVLQAASYVIAMHKLADKYDIPSLMDYCCKMLKHLLSSLTLSTSIHLKIVRLVYKYTRPGHKMRELINTHTTGLMDSRPEGNGIEGCRNFYPLMLKEPELAVVLLKHLLPRSTGL